MKSCKQGKPKIKEVNQNINNFSPKRILSSKRNLANLTTNNIFHSIKIFHYTY